MQANQQVAKDKAGSVAINAKWLDFSCFVLNGNVLDVGHPKIVQCFEELAHYSKHELMRTIEDAVCISKGDGDNLSDTPYNRIEIAGFHGPSAIGIDGKGITLKDILIVLKIDYKYNLTDIDGVSLVEQRNDVLNYLNIKLNIDELTVQLTGAYDYTTEIQ